MKSPNSHVEKCLDTLLDVRDACSIKMMELEMRAGECESLLLDTRSEARSMEEGLKTALVEIETVKDNLQETPFRVTGWPSEWDLKIILVEMGTIPVCIKVPSKTGWPLHEPGVIEGKASFSYFGKTGRLLKAYAKANPETGLGL